MKEKPCYLGHRNRLRQRFNNGKSNGMLDYELLELLLFYSIPRQNVKPIAKDLLKKFHNLSNILDADKGELLSIKDIGQRSAILINLVKELCIKYFEDQIKNRDILSEPKSVIDFAKARLGGLSYEAFMVVFLNIKNEVLHYKVIYEGTIDQAIVYPRRIVEDSLHNHAAGVIIFHNHPSGHCYPSKEDIVITKKIKESLQTVDVHLLDHIIVTKGEYFSFQEEKTL